MDSQPRRPRPGRPDRDARLRAPVIELSWPERTTLDAVAGELIPADETGPGAREAGVVEYIEQSLAGEYAKHGAAYTAGLAELGAAGFASLPRVSRTRCSRRSSAGMTPSSCSSADT